ncbi:DMT family transporter [Cellulomonas bogoriensis]|uniref:Multidrug DMT transporter permease n=1 Tax=Cellulomonas bogoriensis 69B4 = DSM 16987 TaxID=1386082 RepID=A0A0A0BZY8_9CELL|nr:DMT family transporter [Cellulomonas bogoriensis]KGM13978.1 multidrug DMT transporter permease [Cellulomonas bogoriensis 69B4 = DSM 16987]
MTTLAAGAQTGQNATLPSPPPRWLAISAVLVAALFWSSSFAVTKVTLADIPPMTVGALRFTGAAVILGLIVHLRRERVLPSRRQKAGIAGAGLLGITVYFALENVGVDLASASDATLIVATYPLITLVLERLLGRATFSPVRLSGMLLAIVGVAMVVAYGPAASTGQDHHFVGILLLLLGGVAWATYNLVAQRDGSGCSAVVTTYYQTLAGAAGFILLSLFEAGQWSAVSGGSLLRVAYLAVFCSVAAFLAYNFGLKALTPSMAVNLLNTVPVAGLMWAVVLAGETLTPGQVVGGGVVILGVTLGMARTRSQPCTEPIGDPAPTVPPAVVRADS